jgi:T4 RnlA family RNA ligase
MTITKDILEEYLQKDLIVRQSHPDLPLYIWNYSRKTQYEGLWDEVTLTCRALVTDHDGNIVARSFKKFFNLEEGKHTPTKDFKVFKKEDGSLILVFQYNGEWVFASKGSFTSDQAIAAENLFYKLNYHKYLDNEECTHLFELCADWNRIVVKYDKERLILLGMINNKTAEDLDVQALGSWFFEKHAGFIDVVKQYDGIEDYSQLKNMVGENEEGFVVLFSNGDRVKVKGEEYVRLHRIITNISSYDIWEHLKSSKEIDDLLINVPDEFDTWVRNKIRDIRYSYYRVYEYCGKIHDYFRYGKYNDIEVKPSKKDFALHIQKNVDKLYHGVLFAIWDGNFEKLDEIIWNLIKPKYEKPFWEKGNE